MVYDVEMGDIVEEKPALPPQEITIDGRSSTALEIPLCCTVVWEIGVCVV